MGIKESIKNYRDSLAVIKEKKEDIEELKTICELSGISYNERTSGTRNVHANETKIIKMIALKDELEELIYNSTINKLELIKEVNKQHEPREIKVMYFYLNGYTFEEIGEKLGCCKGHARRIYNNAIKHIEAK